MRHMGLVAGKIASAIVATRTRRDELGQIGLREWRRGRVVIFGVGRKREGSWRRCQHNSGHSERGWGERSGASRWQSFRADEGILGFQKSLDHMQAHNAGFEGKHNGGPNLEVVRQLYDSKPVGFLVEEQTAILVMIYREIAYHVNLKFYHALNKLM